MADVAPIRLVVTGGGKRLTRAAAERARLTIKSIPDLPEVVVEDLERVISRATKAKGRWSFVLLNPTRNRTVVKHLRSSSALPGVAVELWAECLARMDTQTGEITASRDELAEAVGVSADDVSRIMSELVAAGAISRERIRVQGMRGQGRVRYKVSSLIATHLPGEARDAAQADAPPFRLEVPQQT